MLNAIVKKMIARDGEREIFDSSFEEMESFITRGKREDFKNERILCVKFLISDNDSLTDAEETSWFINPVYAEEEETDFSIANSYGPKMPSEFLPEILLLPSNCRSSYYSFLRCLAFNNEEDISDEEKYKKFIKFLEEDLND